MTSARLRLLAMYGAAFLILFYMLAPLAVIVPMSLTSGNTLALPTPGWSWRWFEEIFVDDRWLSALRLSVMVGLATTALSLLLGIPAAIGLAWGKFPGKRLVYSVIAAPLVAPIIIVGVAAYSFFATLGLIGNLLAIVLVHTTLAVPVVVTTVVASLAGFDRTLMRAASSMGAGPWRSFHSVLLPLIAPGVLTGAIIAFIISFDEVVVAGFLSSANQRTLPRMIFSGVRESISPAIASVAVLLVLFSAVLLALIGWLQSRQKSTPIRS